MSCLSLHLLWNMVMQIVVRSVCTSGEGRASPSYVTSKAGRHNFTPIEAGAAIKTSPCLTWSSPGGTKLKRGWLENIPIFFEDNVPHRKNRDFNLCLSLLLLQICFDPCHVWCYPWMSVPCVLQNKKRFSAFFLGTIIWSKDQQIESGQDQTIKIT